MRAVFRVWLLVLALAPAAHGGDLVPSRTAVASAHRLATQAGFEMLEQGGNAFDAAVAVSAALAVVEPNGSGLGGGGFYLLHRAGDGHEVMVDGREVAPAAATHDMYLDAHGEPVKGLSRDGPLAAGIPGLAAALVHIAERYGELTLATCLAPAIRHAKQGFPVYPRVRAGLVAKRELLQRWPDGARIFLDHGEVPERRGMSRYLTQPAATL